jgi:CRISPR-associated exonuclease Cas4
MLKIKGILGMVKDGYISTRLRPIGAISWRSNVLDENGLLFTITDLKQYIYCPRILYYHSCLPGVRPVTYKMNAGIEAHEGEYKRSSRRSINVYGVAGQRRFDVNLVSRELALSGQVDEVVETDHELIPVDYKLARRVGHHFKEQLVAYALLLEGQGQKPVQRGFVYLIPVRRTVEVPVTAKLRNEVRRAIETMKSIVERERMPPPTEWRQRCADCEFRRFCNDV